MKRVKEFGIWRCVEWTDPPEQAAREARELQVEVASGEGTHDKLDLIRDTLASRSRLHKLNVLEIGRLYWQARQLLKRDKKFEGWVQRVRESHGLLSPTGARNYIAVYEHCHGRPELVERIPLTRLQRICRPGFPEKLRQVYFDAGKCDEDVERLAELANRYNRNPTDELLVEVRRELGEVDSEKFHLERKRVLESALSSDQSTLARLRDMREWPSLTPDMRGRLDADIQAFGELERSLRAHTRCGSAPSVDEGTVIRVKRVV